MFILVRHGYKQTLLKAYSKHLQVPMMTGVVSDEGMLLGYFLKEHLDKLTVADIG